MAERQKTRRAVVACGQWLAECLRFGWSRDRLDALEALWWEHHDDQGRLTPPTPKEHPPMPHSRDGGGE